MERIYDHVLEDHLGHHRQMLFLSGPRQVGKTTVARTAERLTPSFHYFNWDRDEDRLLVLKGLSELARRCGLEELSDKPPILVFDEIHKFPRWKSWLKGLFDAYEKRCRIIATGSARLDVYKKGGDSLVGRYFGWRLHPLSLREVLDPSRTDELIRPPVGRSDRAWDALFRFGGFPEPFLKGSETFWRRWRTLREELVLRQDVRDLTSVRELGQMELLATALREQAGGVVQYAHLANHLQISMDTVRRWCETLASLYYVFFLRPWSKNVRRSLLKEPKVYLWDWSRIDDPARRLENMVASHLLKAVHAWTDAGQGDFSLHFLRDKEKREVDFLVARDRAPWFLVEVKSSAGSGESPTGTLAHFQSQVRARHAFEAVGDLPHVEADCFAHTKPIRVPARTLLSQLV